MTEWALNAFNIPIAGHDGDSDTQVASIPRPPEGEPTRGQLESSIRIREQLAREGYPYEGEPMSYVAKGTPSIFLISENTGHSTSPKVRQRLDAFLKEWTDRGLQSPDHIRFLTYTTRYNKSFWVTLDGLSQHYERAEVDARRVFGGTSYQIKTTNVSRLVLRETDKATEVQIDGQTVRVKPGRELAFEKTSAGWKAAPARWTGLHKTHGLQGPIDDAFLDPFLLVLVYFGYQTVISIQHLAARARSERLQDTLFGAFLGGLNGYLVAGSILYYIHVADYPFQNVISKPVDPVLLERVNQMMLYMPPQLLGEPGIYFAIILAVVFVLVVYI
jgi:hypothetical protein